MGYAWFAGMFWCTTPQAYVPSPKFSNFHQTTGDPHVMVNYDHNNSNLVENAGGTSQDRFKIDRLNTIKCGITTGTVQMPSIGTIYFS
jgi:hypothetical protein